MVTFFISNLALNTGFGQQDISDLRMNEEDWENGYIERERSKTKVKAKHKLWSIHTITYVVLSISYVPRPRACRSKKIHQSDCICALAVGAANRRQDGE